MIQDAIFIPSDTGHAKADRPPENEAKTRKNQRLKLNKKCGNLHFGYKLHRIDRYGLWADHEFQKNNYITSGFSYRFLRINPIKYKNSPERFERIPAKKKIRRKSEFSITLEFTQVNWEINGIKPQII